LVKEKKEQEYSGIQEFRNSGIEGFRHLGLSQNPNPSIP
jgi:hypothetical protein